MNIAGFFKIALFGLAVSAVSGVAVAQQKLSLNSVKKAPSVRVITEHLPPYQVGERERLVGGIVANKVQNALSQVGINVRIEVLPWARAYQLAKTRPNTLLFSVVKTDAREKHFIWLGKIFTTTTYLATYKNKVAVADELKSLQQHTISVKRDDMSLPNI
ncbi:type 2 periplasmic-binding domain-containing protein [Flocculibacter collagenilyticus]|uniref:hypothetical protein n=1 Tax=Flocculibacter collagenilyticus TaxID=2744479 RepID=UPI0018F4F723|nr:hypothetical protein [Flocculibacter collagenilyticus]